MAELLENKCKNCGADLDLNAAKGRVLICDYCHSKFTLPKEQISPTALALLRSGEQNLDTRHFDDAYIMYQKAAEEDPNEPEAYFGMALAKAQVQYLKDYRANGKEVSTDFRLQPICYEVSEKKFTEDQNFLKAIKLATPEQIFTYKEKGEEIDKIRAEFCALKKSGLSYDCFICVKVTLEDRKEHTEDSHLALQLYHNLKDAGYHPFYSEEEMKDRSGAKYEALILYALYTSDCMLVVCTNDDYLQTPWVRNEYSRYMKMLVEAEKQRESITIAFRDTPIEKLPGLSGKLQGIDLGNFDGLSRILKFVDRFASSKTAIPEIERKDYSGIRVQKKVSIKQDIEKRKIEIIKGGTLTVSDLTKLNTAETFLKREDFPRAMRYCSEVIRDNPATGKAYWLLFLAENGCKDGDAMTRLTKPISNFENFERAIATTEDKETRNEYYIVLSERIKWQRDLNTYSEFIALPEITESWIASMTDSMYDEAIKERRREIFDTIIKTVPDTEKYIQMNLGFAHAVDRRTAMEYYRNVLKADEGNQEALYECFAEDHSLADDRSLLTFCAKEENRAELENGLFSYGFNAYAMGKLMAVVQRSVNRQISEACAVFEFLLSMIPNNNNKMYKEYLNQFINVLFQNEQYENIAKYNDLLLLLDEFDDNAYFNRVMLSRKINNPLALLNYVDELFDDNDYMNAYNAYVSKHGGENLYLTIADSLRAIKCTLEYPECIRFVIQNVIIRTPRELLTCKPQINDALKQQADKYWRDFLAAYRVSSESSLYELDESVENQPKLLLAKKFADAAGYAAMTQKIDELRAKQPISASQVKAQKSWKALLNKYSAGENEDNLYSITQDITSDPLYKQAKECAIKGKDERLLRTIEETGAKQSRCAAENSVAKRKMRNKAITRPFYILLAIFGYLASYVMGPLMSLCIPEGYNLTFLYFAGLIDLGLMIFFSWKAHDTDIRKWLVIPSCISIIVVLVELCVAFV